MHAREVAAVHALPVVITAVRAPRSTCFVQNPCIIVAQGKGVAKGFCWGYHDEYCKQKLFMVASLLCRSVKLLRTLDQAQRMISHVCSKACEMHCGFESL